MELTLKVKSNGENKVLRTDTFELDFGTIEDLLNVIDINKIDDNTELVKMVFNAIGLLKPFVKRIFPEITDEEIRSVSIKELVNLFINVFKFSFDEFGALSTKN